MRLKEDLQNLLFFIISLVVIFDFINAILGYINAILIKIKFKSSYKMKKSYCRNVIF